MKININLRRHTSRAVTGCNGQISKSEITLIRTNQFVDEWFQSLTQNARQDSICNRDCGIALFEYWAEQINMPITWHSFQ